MVLPFSLPSNSVVKKGKFYPAPDGATNVRRFEIYRFNPETDEFPRIDIFDIDLDNCGVMLLDALMKIKDEIDPSFVFRRSCREGICGSCAFNINGKNTLACIKHISEFGGKSIKIYPLPHRPVIRDLVTDLTTLYAQYKAIKPWIMADTPVDPLQERRQSIEENKQLNTLWDCVLCFCCSSACPSYWWNGERGYYGPAILMQAYRWIQDSRDEATEDRLAHLDDHTRLFSCHTILNCTDVCPKNLNPAKAVAEIKKTLVLRK